MRWSDLPLRPSDRMLRQFAALGAVGLACLAVGLALGREAGTAALVVLGLAALVGLLGLAYPGALRPVFVGWMVLVFPVGWLISHLLLALLFYAVFTPLGIVFRLAGRDVLNRRRPGGETYWQPRPAAPDVRGYFRQS